MSITIVPPLAPAPPIASILPPAFPPEPIIRISVEQYHVMIEAGAFANDERVELLEGWLVPKMSKNPAHRVVTRKLRIAFERLLPPGWEVESEVPVTTVDSEPEPDVAVVRAGVLDKVERHPGPRDVGMLIEVSDSTLARDRGIKKRLYARSAVPVYWIVNIPDRCIEVYTDPTGPAENPDYRQPRVYGENDQVPIVLDGKEIGQLEVKSILP
jgi:Uma2 family endonuclease